MALPPTPCLVGPTASGKSAVGVAVARRTRGEVVSCDAFGVYRGLAILTAAPAAPPDVPHHLVGVRATDEPFSAALFAEACDGLVAAIRRRGNTPWVVGGTALYLRGWLKGFGAPVARDPRLRARLRAAADRRGPAGLHAALARRDPPRAAQVHPNDLRRIVRAIEILRLTGRPASAQREEWRQEDRVPAILVGLRRHPQDLAARIRRRTEAMFAEGVLDEVARLERTALAPEVAKVLGLDLCLQVVDGTLAASSAREELVRRTRRFARKQMTFFQSFDGLHWIDVAPEDTTDDVADRVLRYVDGRLRGTSA